MVRFAIIENGVILALHKLARLCTKQVSLARLRNIMKETLLKLHRDSLFRNSFYLILATGVMAGFGFFFWLISARMVTPDNIGIATTLISVMNIIAIFSLIGFDSTLIRFLANSDKKNAKLNTSIILVGCAALLLSSIFIALIHQISPRLEPIFAHPGYAFAFIAFCVMSSINILTDAAFLAYREAKFSLIINAVFSFIKMLLPLLFAPWGAFGIFAAAAGGQTIGFILSIAALMWKFNYRPEFIINKDVLREVGRYSVGNYIAGALNLLPVTLLPLIITNHLGSKESAYFYIVMMIGNLLYAIPFAVTKSLFAESANDERTTIRNVKKSVRFISFLMVPSILALCALGKFILGFFGKTYSSEGIAFLYLVAITGIAVSGYALCSSLLKVRKGVTGLIAMNSIYAGVVIICAYLFIPYGLVGIGYAWLTGNAAAGIFGFLLFRYYRRKVRGTATA